MQGPSIKEIVRLAGQINRKNTIAPPQLWALVYLRVKIQITRRTQGLDPERRYDLINDAALEVMEKLMLANNVDEHFVARLFLSAQQRAIRKNSAKNQKEILMGDLESKI